MIYRMLILNSSLLYNKVSYNTDQEFNAVSENHIESEIQITVEYTVVEITF